MADKNYILRVVKNAKIDRLKEVVNTCHERSGKSKAAILKDIIHCTRKYGSGYYDYQIFAFYNLTEEQRATYVTRLVSKKLNTFLNDPAYIPKMEEKNNFYRNFAKYLHRDYLFIDEASIEDVVKFVEGKKEVFVKPIHGECGHGCQRIKTANYGSSAELAGYIMSCNGCILEDVIKQHPDNERLHPGSVNTMRIITIIGDDGKPHLLYDVQKIGIGDSFIDNNCMFAPVDPETGNFKYPTHSGDTTLGIVYEEHPDTHIHIQGYHISYVKEAIEMCLEAAMVIPQIRYVGWDVAITEDGPAICEGNPYCAHDFWQLPPHTPDGIGMLPTIMKYVPSFKR